MSGKDHSLHDFHWETPDGEQRSGLEFAESSQVSDNQTASHVASSSSKALTSVPRNPKSTRFRETIECYEQLLATLKAELSDPHLESLNGVRLLESTQTCEMCGPLPDVSEDELWSHDRKPHKMSVVTELPSNHGLRQLFGYAKWKNLPAHISIKPNCPSYRSLIIGDMPPLDDTSRSDFETNPTWPAKNPLSLGNRDAQSPASQRDRWLAQSKRITLHHIGLVEDSLAGLKMALSLTNDQQPTFTFEE